ncbi:MAG: DUF697 domain-containing protein, partial [Verrucomicrobia bacterium]|nr:DUF697 domain-containing protein [Verrucomicrobiota bacterium]
MSATTATTAPATAAPAAALCANQIVKSSMILAAGAGAVPVPAWDAALVFGVQLKMLADLSAAYRVPFSENIGKSAVAALLGGLAPALIVQGAAGSVLKGLPVVGGLLSL